VPGFQRIPELQDPQEMATIIPPRLRLTSLDQFRGYTVAGMFLVNFLGSFAATPFLLKHHLVFCSYADTIMPQFFFAVGFSMRLSFSHRVEATGAGKAYWHAVNRCLGLAIIAIVWYGGRPYLPDGVKFEWNSLKEIGLWGAVWKQLKVDWFQTLLHIAATSLWILPVICKPVRWRILFLVTSAVLHFGLNQFFYFQWHNGETTGIDGGPLGFLTWCIPTLVGTFACDLVTQFRAGEMTVKTVVRRMVSWSVLMMVIGWGMSCGTRLYDVADDLDANTRASLPVLSPAGVVPPKEAIDRWLSHLRAGHWDRIFAEPPFVPPPHSRDTETVNGRDTSVNRSAQYRQWNYWMMSQQCGSISYLTFTAGVSLAVFCLFFLLSDVFGTQIGVFRTLGVNAMFGYFLHSIVESGVKSFMPSDIAVIPMWIGFSVYFFLCWLMLRHLENNRIFLKL